MKNEVLQGVNEDRNNLYTIKNKKRLPGLAISGVETGF